MRKKWSSHYARTQFFRSMNPTYHRDYTRKHRMLVRLWKTLADSNDSLSKMRTEKGN